MASSLDGVSGLALVNGAVVTTIDNSSGTTLMSSTSGDINITAASGFKVNLSNTSISGPMDIGGSPGAVGQVPVSQGPGLPVIWGTGGGSVTSVGLAMPSIFTVSGSPVTLAGTLTAALNTQVANGVFVGPITGAAAIPTFRALDAADITTALLTPPAIGTTTPAAGKFTTIEVTSSIIYPPEANNVVFAGPITGGPLAPTFRALNPADLTSALLTPPAIGATTPAAGKFTTLEVTSGLIFPPESNNTFFSGPSTGGPLAPAFRTITAADITSPLTTSLLTPPAIGTTTPAAGKFTNLTVTGSITYPAQADNTFYSGPSTGGPLVPTFRTIAAADIDTPLITSLMTPPSIGGTTPNSAIFTDAVLTTGSITSAPVALTDIANKDYVDTYVQGLTSQSSVAAATTGPITLTGAQSVDGVPLTAGMECLVKDQATQADNGVYTVAAGPWTRATTMSIWSQFHGAFVFTETGGSTNGGTGWVCTAPVAGTINVTAVTFGQFSAAGTYTAGAGLTLTGTVFSAKETNYPLAVTANGSLAAVLTANAVTDRAGNTYSLFNTTAATVTLTTSVNNAISYPANATAGSVIVDAGETVLIETVTANALYAVTSSSKDSGTVNSVSVVSANGLAGTVATATSTPAITLTTTVTGIVKGNGTALSAATAGTDYSAGTSALATGILKNTTTTGVLTIATAGTDYVVPGGALGTPSSGVLTNATGLPLTSGVTGVLPIANGGTGQITAALAINALVPTQTGNVGKVLTTDGSVVSWATNGTGTVNTVSVVSANGFTGTVANPTTAPDITLTTSITGMLKGDGTAISAAVAGTDYVAPGGAGVFSSVTDSGLTATRVVFAGASGLLSDDADMTFDGTALTLVNDALISGLTVGKGLGAVVTNTVVGAGALAANTTGAQNTAIGKQALAANTTGDFNIAIGMGSLFSNVTGASNTAIGTAALSLNTVSGNTAVGANTLSFNVIGTNNVAVGDNALAASTGNYNTAVGSLALTTATSGDRNTAIGGKSLQANTTGLVNTAVGYLSLSLNTTGIRNTAMGGGALNNNTTGGFNTASGQGALANNTTGSSNTAMGANALLSNTTGTPNTAVGYQALQANVTGTNNVAVGDNALLSNTADFNTAVGSGALQANTTGIQNNAVGYGALSANTSGVQNNAFGKSALASNTTGGWSSAFGSNALFSNTTGDLNTAVGRLSLYLNSTGSNNVASGASALQNNTTGSSNTASGTGALQNNTTADFNTANGYQALFFNTTGTNNTASGAGALSANTTGGSNTASGFNALQNNTTGTPNTAVGYQALKINVTGTNNVAVGDNALLNNTASANTAVGSGALRANTANFNTAVGSGALQANTSGSQNTASGLNALASNTTGSNNTASGVNALLSNTTGSNNTASGPAALQSNTTGSNNTASGQSALYFNTTGSYNTASGLKALYNNTTGDYNIAVGYQALQSNTTGPNNAVLGTGAFVLNVSGGYNTVLGNVALQTTVSGNNNVAIGYSASASSTTVSNEVNIYNGTVTARFQGAAGAWSFVSDARDKTDVEPLTLGLEFITGLQPRKFKWDIRDCEVDKGKEASGFIAQEVLEVIEVCNAGYTGLVDTNNPDQYTVATGNLIPILVNAIKELTARLEILEGK